MVFCGGRYPHLPSRGALPSVVPPLLPCWLPQLHHHLWGSALDPGAAGHPPAGMVKEMGDSEQPSSVNLWGERRQSGSAWGVAGIIQVEERWRSCWPGRTGGDASIRRERQALALPRAAGEMAERGLRLHHPAWDPVSEGMPGVAALLLLILLLLFIPQLAPLPSCLLLVSMIPPELCPNSAVPIPSSKGGFALGSRCCGAQRGACWMSSCSDCSETIQMSFAGDLQQPRH